MSSIPDELYPLIWEYVPLHMVKIFSTMNHSLYRLSRPTVFCSVWIRFDSATLSSQLAFFNGANGAMAISCIKELFLNMYGMRDTLSAASEYEAFFSQVAPHLRALHIDGKWNLRKYLRRIQDDDFQSIGTLLANFLPSSNSLASLAIVETCPVPLTELLTLCPSVRSIHLVYPRPKFLDSSVIWNVSPCVAPKLRSILLNCYIGWPPGPTPTIPDIIGQCINATYHGMTSGIGSLSLQGMQWYAKEELTHFLDSFPTPIILFDNLRDLHFPPVFYEYIDETSPPMSLSKLLTLKTITFVIGSMTASVSRNWSGFFTWLLNVFSGPHSLEKAIFEVSLQEYVPVDDLMMSMDVLDGGSASIPELTFVLVMSGNDWMEERRCKAFIGWLKRELPTLVAAGKLVIVWRWPQEGIWSW